MVNSNSQTLDSTASEKGRVEHPMPAQPALNSTSYRAVGRLARVLNEIAKNVKLSGEDLNNKPSG